MSVWAQRLKRVFGIDVNTCIHCGGKVRIVASIEDPAVIRAILGHFEKHGAIEQAHYRPPARAPPAAAACARRPKTLLWWTWSQPQAKGRKFEGPDPD